MTGDSLKKLIRYDATAFAAVNVGHLRAGSRRRDRRADIQAVGAGGSQRIVFRHSQRVRPFASVSLRPGLDRAP